MRACRLLMRADSKQSEDAAARPMVKKRPSPDSDKRTAESDSLSNRPQTTCSVGEPRHHPRTASMGVASKTTHPPPEPAHPHLSERGLPPSCRRRACSARAARSQAAGRRLRWSRPDDSRTLFFCRSVVIGWCAQTGRQARHAGRKEAQESHYGHAARLALARQRRHRRNVDCWCRAAPTFGRRRALGNVSATHLPFMPALSDFDGEIHCSSVQWQARLPAVLYWRRFSRCRSAAHASKRCTSGTMLCRTAR